ncbi:hypothetical protein LTR66_016342 [Elasticomyces elasticus]|nr:hypothetical protein LTR66_016342 [Elasticomyces elasticus]
MSGGFTAGSGAAGTGGRMKTEPGGDVEVLDNKRVVDSNALMRTQALAGRVKPAEEGDPVYMLATFKDKNLHLSPISSVVQFHPQLHHLDALDEMPKAKGLRGKKDDDERPAPETEARAIDIKVKAAEDGETTQTAGNLDILKQMQEEKWTKYGWIDAETEESWYTYESFMLYDESIGPQTLEASLDSEEYLDKMSAPRIDPARPDLTGWAMKENRKRQREAQGAKGDQ